jgi:hypothetical protein
MECSADDFRSGLIEVVTVRNSPTGVCDCVVDFGGCRCVRSIDNVYLLFGIVLGDTLLGIPGEYSSVPCNSVYLLSAHDYDHAGKTYRLFIFREPSS